MFVIGRNTSDCWCLQIPSCGRAASYRLFTTSRYASPPLTYPQTVYLKTGEGRESSCIEEGKTLAGLWNRNASLYNSLLTALWLFWITETTRLQMAVLRDVPVVHTLCKGDLHSQKLMPFSRYTVLCNFIYMQNQSTTFSELISRNVKLLRSAALYVDLLWQFAPIFLQ
jgi:hypothetical protein